MTRFSFNVHIHSNLISKVKKELENHSSFKTRLERPSKKPPIGEEIVEIRVKVNIKGQSEKNLIGDIIAAHGGSIAGYFRIGPITWHERIIEFLKKIWLTTTAVYLGTIGSIVIYNFSDFFGSHKSGSEITPNIITLFLVCFIPAFAAGLTELKK